jgi:hypothetical protein
MEGELREAELFGENMVLRRTIKTVFGEKAIYIHDIVENQSFRDESLAFMYHVNYGYPLLDENARVILPSLEVKGREKLSEAHIAKWSCMDKPLANEEEYVFIHNLAVDKSKNTFATLYNSKLGIGITERFNQGELPNFYQWKSIGAGDYVMGLEPSNSGVLSRKQTIERGDKIHALPSFAKEEFHISFEIIEGDDAVLMAEKESEVLIKYATSVTCKE